MKDHITQMLLVIIATFLGTLGVRPYSIRTRCERKRRGLPVLCPYPVSANAGNTKPPKSEPTYLGQFELGAAKR
jgi:hypothetical protein